MARNGNLFALTGPDGTVGIFHQLGTIVPGRISVQNCLVEKFGNNNVKIEKGLANLLSRNGDNYHLYMPSKGNGVGYLNTPDGIYIVERITAADPRYNSSSVIREYSDFFGNKVVKKVEAYTWAETRKKEKAEYTQHMKAIQLLDKLIGTLGYIKQPVKNIAPLRRAAKK